MSNTTFIGRQMRSFDSSPQFDGFSKVVIQVSDEVEYSAGNDSGRVMTLVNPWGNQAMADRLLARIKGFQYQPFTATGARLDPSAELGDAVTANNVHGGIYTRKEVFGSTMTSTISAPEDEELDHEYQYVSKQDRLIKRNMRELTAELKVQAGLIAAEVAERKSDIEQAYAALSIQADRITQEVTARQNDVQTLTASLIAQAGLIEAKVSKTGGVSSSFGWALTDSDWTIKANGATVLRATKSGLEISGKITANEGKVGGFDIRANYLSYNNQTWGGTNNTGIYIGSSGIQLGQNFKVDNNGHLTAASGTFTGNVNAGNVQYGGSAGYLSGAGVASHSINSEQLQYNSVGPSYVSGGIRQSLGYADYAYGAFMGWNEVGDIRTRDLRVAGTCTIHGHDLHLYSQAIVTPSGQGKTIYYWGSE